MNKIDKDKLVFKRISLWGKEYDVLQPQTPDEFLYGLINDLLSIGTKTEIKQEKNLLDLNEMLLRLN
jgi:hypothetical protein